jgi:transposase-like protein
MCVLQIGELVGHLSDDITARYAEMPWKQIKGMRNIAAHGYENFDIGGRLAVRVIGNNILKGVVTMNEKARELVGMLAQECESMQDIQELLKNLFKGTIEEILECEMDEHLGYDKHSSVGDLSGNSRNGYNKKTIQTQMGKAEIKIPRDRNGEFEPHLIEKYQNRSDGLETKIIAMYAKGMSTRDIEDHLRDIYGIDASPALISRITDKVLPAVQEWQSRPLDRTYPIVFLDGIIYKLNFRIRQQPSYP